MSKRIALKDFIEADHVDLSNYARGVGFNSEHERVDVSGFNSAGTSEFLAGTTTQEFTAEFFGSYGSGEVHQTLYGLHRDRTIFPVKWRHDSSAGVSATNPELRGNVQLLTYGPAATRGDVEVLSATFTAADSAGLTFVST